MEPLKRVYHETLRNRGWCLLCLRLGAIISWSVNCRFASGSWTSTHSKEKAPRPLTQTGLRKLFAALGRKLPERKLRLCTHFTCLRQSLRLVLPAADTSTLAGAAGNVQSAWFTLRLPCVITALRFNSAAGTSDSSAFRRDAVRRARYCTLFYCSDHRKTFAETLFGLLSRR